jgi:hypothetical protein
MEAWKHGSFYKSVTWIVYEAGFSYNLRPQASSAAIIINMDIAKILI